MADNQVRQSRAHIKNLRCSPRKVNLVLGLLRGRKVNEALKQLSFSAKRVSNDLHKLLFSAISNAENNHNMDVDRLVVDEAYAGKGMLLKRFHARARGRGARVNHRYSNVTIVLSEEGQQ